MEQIACQIIVALSRIYLLYFYGLHKLKWQRDGGIIGCTGWHGAVEHKELKIRSRIRVKGSFNNGGNVVY